MRLLPKSVTLNAVCPQSRRARAAEPASGKKTFTPEWMSSNSARNCARRAFGELALALKNAYQQDRSEVVRMASFYCDLDSYYLNYPFGCHRMALIKLSKIPPKFSFYDLNKKLQNSINNWLKSESLLHFVDSLRRNL